MLHTRVLSRSKLLPGILIHIFTSFPLAVLRAPPPSLLYDDHHMNYLSNFSIFIFREIRYETRSRPLRALHPFFLQLLQALPSVLFTPRAMADFQFSSPARGQTALAPPARLVHSRTIAAFPFSYLLRTPPLAATTLPVNPPRHFPLH